MELAGVGWTSAISNGGPGGGLANQLDKVARPQLPPRTLLRMGAFALVEYNAPAMDILTVHLDPGSVAAEPISQFQVWFEETVQAGQPEPEAMALATASKDGRISNRIVLLKGCDQRGFTFFTNYESRKSTELTEDSWAALTFFWQSLHRQVRIEGKVKRVSSEESAAYFATRPRGSQLGAWASPQSSEIADRAELLRRLEEIEQRFQDGPVPCPPNWGGFRLFPEAVEFWQGRESRLHERVLYTRQEDGNWRTSLLAP